MADSLRYHRSNGCYRSHRDSGRYPNHTYRPTQPNLVLDHHFPRRQWDHAQQIGIQSKTINSELQLVPILPFVVQESTSIHFQEASGFQKHDSSTQVARLLFEAQGGV